MEELIQSLFASNEHVELLVGRNGEFDQAVSSVIRRVKRSYRDDNSCHILVLPYSTAEFRDNTDSFYAYYDDVEISDELVDAHFKAAMQSRNRSMVDRSNLVVFYVEHKKGGAYQMYQYAVKKDKKIVNLSEKIND